MSFLLIVMMVESSGNSLHPFEFFILVDQALLRHVHSAHRRCPGRNIHGRLLLQVFTLIVGRATVHGHSHHPGGHLVYVHGVHP